MSKITKKILLLIFLFLIPVFVSAERIIGEYGDYDTAINIVKETMKSYYIRGPYIQYNYAKSYYPIGSPEEATSQDNNYSVCASYTYSVYTEGFGMKYNKTDSKFPRYNFEISDTAYEYYKDKIEYDGGMDEGDGTFLLYYQHALLGDHDEEKCTIDNINRDTDNKIKYVYKDTDTSNVTGDLETLIDNIKPGDLFVHSGHALIAYDVVINPNTNKKDVLLLNSTADEYIRTRIDGTSKLSYNFFSNPNGNNGVLNLSEEGSIQYLWLSDVKEFVNSAGNLSCQTHECAVIRPFYEQNKKAVFNYYLDTEQYNRGYLRTQYPGLLIEKTVDVGDNNSVNIGDELTYTIKITNKSSVTNVSSIYSFFTVEESLGNLVEYISSNGNYSNNKISWDVSELSPNEKVELTYKVRVKKDISNISKTIKSTGSFSASNNRNVSISTGVVENKIIPSSSKITNSYQECYDSNKSKYNGLELIDKIYSCVYPNKHSIGLKENFDFNKIFTKDLGTDSKVNSKIMFTDSEKSSPTFSNMILNNYFSGVVNNSNKYYLPRFDVSPRARTINSRDFKNGDVLIYYIDNSKFTNEEGLYAYIYIDGKFVGMNGKGNTLRNEFVYSYYGESYSKHIDESICKKYSLSASSTCDYFYNLYGGYTKLNSTNKEEILEFANYETLFDKDYYIILRPSSYLIDKPSNPPTGINLGYGILMIIVSTSVILLLLLRKKSKFIKHS